MARNKEQIEKRNKQINEEYKKLSNKKDGKGRCIYTYTYILEKLSKKFFLQESMISKILE